MKESEYLSLFKNWYLEATLYEKQPDAMSLATCGKNGQPSNRIVLLKHYDELGFVFYTNLNSHKAKQLMENPQASLCFYWQQIGKQIRIEGKTELVTPEEADDYFRSRPRGSQIGAWASYQSQVLNHYEDLLKKVEAMQKEFTNQDVPRPPFWSGFRVIANLVEFWEVRESRLHKRVVFSCEKDRWDKKLLSP